MNQIENTVVVYPLTVITPAILANTLYAARSMDIVDIMKPIMMDILSGLLLFEIIISKLRAISFVKL